MLEDNGLNAILAARKRIEDAIEIELAKVAALRKRVDALSIAADVLRCGDDDMIIDALSIRAKLKPSATDPKTKTRVLDFDEAVLTGAIEDLLKTPVPMVALRRALDSNGVAYSIRGLKEILATHPRITRSGERHLTRFAWVNGQK